MTSVVITQLWNHVDGVHTTQYIKQSLGPIFCQFPLSEVSDFRYLQKSLNSWSECTYLILYISAWWKDEKICYFVNSTVMLFEINCMGETFQTFLSDICKVWIFTTTLCGGEIMKVLSLLKSEPGLVATFCRMYKTNIWTNLDNKT